MSRRTAARSVPVTRAREKASKRSGARCSASPTRKAASATGSVVPWAKTSLAARKRDTAWRTRSRIVAGSRAGFLARAGGPRFGIRFFRLGVIAARADPLLDGRRNADEVLDLLGCQRLLHELVLERVGEDQVEPADLVRPQGGFGKILVANFCHQGLRHA